MRMVIRTGTSFERPSRTGKADRLDELSFSIAPTPLTRASAGLVAGPMGLSQGLSWEYDRLMEVSIQHPYFNGEHAIPHEFIFRATPDTTTKMENWGLKCYPERRGFSILYDRSVEPTLQHPLAPGVLARLRDGEPQWLSFQLVPRTQHFLNITQLPADMSPLSRNLYFSNGKDSKTADGEIVLPVAGLLPDKPLIPFEDVLRIRQGDTLAVKDVAGAIVLTGPLDEAGINAIAALKPEAFSLAKLPDGRYTQTGAWNAPPDFLWVQSAPAPLCVLDLVLFAGKPTSAKLSADFCPIRAEGAPIVPLKFRLDFKTRETFWKYYVVPRRQPNSLEDLTIVPAGDPPAPGSPEAAGFEQMADGRLPNGKTAFRFISKQAIPMKEYPDVLFQLRGRRKDTAHSVVLMDPLPAPDKNRLARDKDLKEFCSEMYVYV